MGDVIRESWLLVLLAVLATARLTVLVVDDYITTRLRAWVGDHGPDWAVYLVQCAWCVSIYTGAAVAAAVYAWPDTWPVQVALIGLAASYVTGTLAERRPE